MPTLAKTGHGSTVAFEPDPSSAQGTFSVIAEQNGDLTWGTTRGVTEVTAHNHTIDYHVPDGRLMRDTVTVPVNWVFDNATHASGATSLRGLHHAGTETGFRFRGPGGSAGSDEWICSGYVIGVVQTNPVREGVRSAEITIQLSGPMIVDGVTVGADAF